MFLGIILSSEDFFGFDRFHFLGFIGYIVLFLYFMFIIKCRKGNNNKFNFSIVVLLFYLFIVLFFTVKLKCNITTFNLLWYVPFSLCVIVDGIGYLIKYKNKRSGQ